MGCWSRWISWSKAPVSCTVPKGPGSWHEELRRASKLVDRDNDGLVFVDINVVERLGYVPILECIKSMLGKLRVTRGSNVEW